MRNKEGYTWNQYIKDYWTLLEKNRTKFVIYTVLRSLSNLAPFVEIYLLGKIIDFFTLYQNGEPLQTFYYLVGGIALAGTFQVLLRFFAKVHMQTIAANIRKDVRVKAMSTLMQLELKWHEKEETGSKIHKINEGGESIFNGIKDFSNSGLNILTTLIGSIGIFLALNWQYAVFSLVFSIIYLYAENFFNIRLNYWQDQLNIIKEKVSGKIHESASNVLTVKSLGLKEAFQKSAKAEEERYYKTWLKKRAAGEIKLKVIKIGSNVVKAGFILFVGFDYIRGNITLGSILIYVSYFGSLIGALHMTSHNMSTFISSKSGVGRFMTIFGQEIIDREEGKIKVSKNWKTIEFKKVWFQYKDKFALNNFNFFIKRGEKVGLVGRSGCGKSTVAKLLLGLYQQQKGQMQIDKKNMNDYSHKSITDTISVVLQESEMFNLSLMENVTIISPKKNLDKFKKAAKTSQLEPLIKKLPLGLNTLIGEKGYQLSGGERQRVGLARAVYKDSSLLLLDEATSALDSKTEDLIQKSLEKEMKDKTLLIIAHRLSTLKKVDRIVVMDKGRAVEEGTFDQLIAKKGKFYKLYQLQRNR
jgi:ABC-type multidrug transport system fused ATPase/permease subunit